MPTSARFASQPRVTLPGSERKPFAARPAAVNQARPSYRPITVSVIVRPKQPIDPTTLGLPGSRLTRAQYLKRHGADPASIRLVKAFAHEFGLTVVGTHPARRTVQLSGTSAALQKAFGVTLTTHQPEAKGSAYRLREGAITLPQELTGHVLAVLGLDNRPQAQPHFRIATPHATNISYTPVQVAQLYQFPTGPATGQTIGLIELGGGYRAADLKAYFATLNLPNPAIVAVPVDGGANSPTTSSSADGEVMLDIEVSAAVASGAKIAVYFTPNTDQGFLDAITTAVHDPVNKPSVLSISWGGPESTWTTQAMNAMDAACQAAAALGVTITVAAGDNGSSDGVSGTASHVDFPASSPHVLACGGTTLTASGSNIAREVVWNETAANEGATGGGVSVTFPLPAWQSAANVPASPSGAPGRGVPDVAGDADPSTGYTVRVDGQTMVIGGTSAVAPLWAALIALANARNKTAAGFINPTLYAASTAFHDITSGNNGAYSAAPGWDPCTGLGSPIGTGIAQALATPAAAPTKAKGKPKPTKKPTVKKSRTTAK
jgi:kumamolisin